MIHQVRTIPIPTCHMSFKRDNLTNGSHIDSHLIDAKPGTTTDFIITVNVDTCLPICVEDRLWEQRIQDEGCAKKRPKNIPTVNDPTH